MRKFGNAYQNMQGPVTVGSPTGGFEGAGSINAVALFINGVAVTAGTGAGGVVSVTGTANQVTASPTTGAVVVGLPQNVIIPTPASGVALTINQSASITGLVVAATSGNGAIITAAGNGNGAGATAVFIEQDGSSIGYLYNAANAALNLGTNNAARINIAAAGNVTVNTPSSGTAFTVNGASGGAVMQVTGTGVSPTGVSITGSATNQLNAISIQQTGQAQWLFYTPASSNDLRLFTGSDRVVFTSTGNVTINTPTSGVALTVNAVGTTNAINVALAGNSTGVQVNGVAATQFASLSMTQAGQNSWFLISPASSNNIGFYTLGNPVLTLGGAGNVTIAAPSSGIGLAVAGASDGSSVVRATIGAAATAFDARAPAATQLTALSLTQTGQTGWLVYQPASSNDLRFFAGADRVLFSAAGNVTINAPTSGVALTVTAVANSYAQNISAPNTAGQSFGLTMFAGTNSSDTALNIVNAANSLQFLKVSGTGCLLMGSPTGGDQGLGTVNATGLFVNGVAVGSGSTTLKAVALTTQSVTSSTTYVADTSLTLALTTGKYYQIYAQVPFKNASGVTGGGANFAFTYSGTGGILWGDDLSSSSTIGQPQVQGVSPTTFNSFQNIAPNAFDTGGNMWVFFGTMFAGSVGGNLLVNWAQNTSSATATIRQIGAIMTAIQLN